METERDLEEIRRKWEELEEEARQIRRSMADWSFIEKQPPHIKAALELYIENGDIRLAARIAKMKLEEFRELLRKANIPVVV